MIPPVSARPDRTSDGTVVQVMAGVLTKDVPSSGNAFPDVSAMGDKHMSRERPNILADAVGVSEGRPYRGVHMSS